MVNGGLKKVCYVWWLWYICVVFVLDVYCWLVWGSCRCYIVRNCVLGWLWICFGFCCYWLWCDWSVSLLFNCLWFDRLLVCWVMYWVLFCVRFCFGYVIDMDWYWLKVFICFWLVWCIRIVWLCFFGLWCYCCFCIWSLLNRFMYCWMVVWFWLCSFFWLVFGGGLFVMFWFKCLFVFCCLIVLG